MQTQHMRQVKTRIRVGGLRKQACQTDMQPHECRESGGETSHHITQLSSLFTSDSMVSKQQQADSDQGNEQAGLWSMDRIHSLSLRAL